MITGKLADYQISLCDILEQKYQLRKKTKGRIRFLLCMKIVRSNVVSGGKNLNILLHERGEIVIA